MAKIKVTPEVLEQTAGKIEGIAADYEAQYNKLYGETDALATAWQGKDNIAFKEQIDGFKDDFQQMKQLMDQYAQFLRQAAQQYRDTQDTIVTEVKKLAN